MKQLGKVEMAKKKLAMRTRALLRLKANEQYVDELNELLPALEAEHDAAIQAGVLPAPIDIESMLEKARSKQRLLPQ